MSEDETAQSRADRHPSRLPVSLLPDLSGRGRGHLVLLSPLFLSYTIGFPFTNEVTISSRDRGRERTQSAQGVTEKTSFQTARARSFVILCF